MLTLLSSSAPAITLTFGSAATSPPRERNRPSPPRTIVARSGLTSFSRPTLITFFAVGPRSVADIGAVGADGDLRVRRNDQRPALAQHRQAGPRLQLALRADPEAAAAGVGFAAVQRLHREEAVALDRDVEVARRSAGSRRPTGRRRRSPPARRPDSRQPRSVRPGRSDTPRSRPCSRPSTRWRGCSRSPPAGETAAARRSSRCRSGGPWQGSGIRDQGSESAQVDQRREDLVLRLDRLRVRLVDALRGDHVDELLGQVDVGLLDGTGLEHADVAAAGRADRRRGPRSPCRPSCCCRAAAARTRWGSSPAPAGPACATGRWCSGR